MSESLSEASFRSTIHWAAVRWRDARMAMINAPVKADNRPLLDELGSAEDALSKAVAAWEMRAAPQHNGDGK